MASFSNLAASGSGLSPSPAAKEILATSQELERRSSFKSTSSPFTALLAISGAFASIALIPYLLTRRHISKLELQVRSLQEIAVKQRQEWKHDILRSRLQHAHSVRVMTKYRTLEHKMNVLQRVHSRHYRSIVKLGDTTRSQMNALTAEIMDIKKSRMGLSSRLSGVLADIAAFMHECEITQGLPPRRSSQDDRGIDTIRQFALDLTHRSKL